MRRHSGVVGLVGVLLAAVACSEDGAVAIPKSTAGADAVAGADVLGGDADTADTLTADATHSDATGGQDQAEGEDAVQADTGAAADLGPGIDDAGEDAAAQPDAAATDAVSADAGSPDAAAVDSDVAALPQCQTATDCTGALAACQLWGCDAGLCKAVALPDASSCTDDNACTTSDHCAGGACQPGAAKACDDGNPCTSDACEPATGACAAKPAAGFCEIGRAHV